MPAVLLLGLAGCSSNSGSGKPKIEHSLKVRFVDEKGDNLFNNQNYTDEAIKIVTYDKDGIEHDFFNGDWFAMLGYTVDRYYGRYVFTIYFTLPDEGGPATTETFMRFFGEGPDVFTAEYEIRQGNDPDEPYGGGTVRVKTVKFNGRLIWEMDGDAQEPVEILKQLPSGQ